jgi:Cohesin domain/PEP-CTERM motif
MNRLKWATIVAGVLLASVFSSPIWADGVTLSAVASASTVSVGDSFTVDVNVANVSDLYAYEFDLGFTNGVVAFTGVQEGTFLASGGSTIFISGAVDGTGANVAGTADTLVGPPPGVTGSGNLVIFDFTAIGSGISNFTIPNNSDLFLLDSGFNSIEAALSGTSVTVQGNSTVPEPSSLLLLLVGLSAFALFVLKKPSA